MAKLTLQGHVNGTAAFTGGFAVVTQVKRCDAACHCEGTQKKGDRQRGAGVAGTTRAGVARVLEKDASGSVHERAGGPSGATVYRCACRPDGQPTRGRYRQTEPEILMDRFCTPEYGTETSPKQHMCIARRRA